ncbi:tryptophan--tRNA ligase [archaeon CG_4_10_14_0_2_um_filter_Archaea_38_6]|nr:MAG: tryptophan--tRNA ligase [archaeon CG_4_10_14_0_2_um_filter_Archaea_38_6]
MKLDAWGSVNVDEYDHVFKEFGLSEFNDFGLIDHYLFRRKIIVAHRDFEKIKKAILNKSTFIQLTGIASSGDLHFGHKLDVDFFKVFNEAGAKSKFCVCDIDAYVSRPDDKVPSMKTAKETAVRNVADIIALGVKPEDIYVQSQKDKEYFQFCFEVSKKITKNAFEAIYGHIDLGKMAAVFLQIGDILHIQLPYMFGKNPSITGIGLEQDPHARITRDVAARMEYDFEKPSFFYFQHQSGLKQGKKMSKSEPDTAIFLNDTEEEVKRKMNNAFTGGKISLKEQREKGGNPDICKIYELLRFHYPDDDLLEETYQQCKKGKILCGECKQKCINFLITFLKEHKEKYEKALPIANKLVYGTNKL